jgi:PTS system mannose-specific IIC component
LTFTTASLLELTSSGEIALVLVATVPMAWLGTRLESFHRTLQNASYNTLVLRIRRGFSTPPRLVGRSLFQSMGLQFGVFFVLQTLLVFFFEQLFSRWSADLAPDFISWNQLWILATLGPILSLRHRLPYIYFGVTVLVIGFLMWLVSVIPPEKLL